ncbi:hypothetical protein KY290_002554 [Solanum tuberosum]|uniref:Uncharacterized protein n=1 Tax=Solanum tuberosum TaxID=4113 RepID=A0ABQ7WRR2_SOLTU|nr:hypothetical protein KY290_002554 [Solanum tuberosum]
MNFPPEVKFGYFSFIMNFPHDLHVFEVNTDMVQQFEDAGLSFTGKDESGRRMEALGPAMLRWMTMVLHSLEDDLLCTRASPSLLPLLSSGFGIPLSSLNNLFSEDGSFLLSGYILGVEAVLVPRGFRDRCVEGMQIVVIEYARSILGLLDVNSTEFDPNTNNPWVNPDTVQQFKDAGLSFIGKDESGCRMEFTPSLNLTLFPPGICCYRLETCYVKVDDDGSSEVVLSFEGSGVSQDGLVLMGKR